MKAQESTKPKRKQRPSTRETREMLWDTGNRFCAYCGAELTLKRDKPNSMTIDHRKPFSRGGTLERHNVFPSCEPCNMKKGSRSAAQKFVTRTGKPL